MKKIRRVLVVFKPKAYQYFGAGPSHPSIKRMREAHQSHLATISLVKKTLNRLQIPYDVETRKIRRNVKRYDLFITVGGDGTFLRTSHVVKNQLILGVNSCPWLSVGALCTVTPQTFPKKIREILRGNFSVRELNRLQFKVNQRWLPFTAANDVLFASNCPGGTSRYLIKVRKKEEDQKSSGIWISTAMGSTAGIFAAGGKKMEPLSRKIQYFVREPYGRNRYTLSHGILKPDSQIQLINMAMKAALYIDGMQGIYRIKFGDKILIKNSRQTLHVIQ